MQITASLISEDEHYLRGISHTITNLHWGKKSFHSASMSPPRSRSYNTRGPPRPPKKPSKNHSSSVAVRPPLYRLFSNLKLLYKKKEKKRERNEAKGRIFQSFVSSEKQSSNTLKTKPRIGHQDTSPSPSPQRRKMLRSMKRILQNIRFIPHSHPPQ